MSSHLDLLIACGASPSATVSSYARRLLAATQDLPGVADLAHAHGMLPLLSRALAQDAPEIIRALAARKAMRSLWMAGELARILRLLEAAGTSPIAFKGPTLAWLAYGDIALRDSTDLDIFIPRHQLTTALDVLTSQGYRYKSRGQSPSLSGSCEVALRRPEPQCEIALHWLFSPSYFLPFDAARATARSIVIRTSGLVARTLCPEDLLLYLCIHSCRECWPLVRNVCDVAALIRRQTLNWDDLVGEAHRTHCWRALAVGLHLAAGLFQPPIPDEILKRVTGDAAVHAIARRLSHNVLQEAENYAGAPGGALLHLRMFETNAARLGYLWRRAFQPNFLDADFIHLPKYLTPAYYLVRPLRVAFTALNRLRA